MNHRGGVTIHQSEDLTANTLNVECNIVTIYSQNSNAKVSKACEPTKSFINTYWQHLDIIQEACTKKLHEGPLE